MTEPRDDQNRSALRPAILRAGFRLLFLLAGLWAVIAMGTWIALLSGSVTLPTRFDPITWHAHAFLFGYLGAVIAGFLLTAVPNWTGRPPVAGWPLAGLAVLWLLGRIAIAVSTHLPVWSVALADIAFLATLWVVILRELVAAKNWSNLPVLAIVGAFVMANAIFHIEAAHDAAAHGIGLRLGVSVALTLITLIGGKIIPSFTKNWMSKRGRLNLPTPPMQRFDKVVILATIGTLLVWVFAPALRITSIALIGIGVLHLIRLARWKGASTGVEPLVWVLHIAYGFIPLGALCTGVANLTTGIVGATTALHIWTAGAIGLMTIGVMTRASLGHSGQALRAGLATKLIYLSLIGSVVMRVLADMAPAYRMALLDASALLWIGCFAGFVVAYGPMLVIAKRAPSP